MPKCELCPRHGRRGRDRHDADGAIALASDEPGSGVRIIDSCEECVSETFEREPDFQPYDSLEQ